MSLFATYLQADRAGWREEIERLDEAVYSAVAATPTPQLDRCFRGLSRAADRSKLWLAGAAALAAAALVAYSRVHTGVHFPSDTIVGSVIGAGLAPTVVAALDHRRSVRIESAR